MPFHTPTLRGMWIYGKTGTGKSRYVWDTYPDAYRKDMQDDWY